MDGFIAGIGLWDHIAKYLKKDVKAMSRRQ
jgi:hypothetical protein